MTKPETTAFSLRISSALYADIQRLAADTGASTNSAMALLLRIGLKALSADWKVNPDVLPGTQ